MELAKIMYASTESFPKTETYGIIAQMRRSSVSISSNIAEGTSRNSRKELCRFLDIAIGSVFELETQIILSKELEFLNKEDAEIIESKIIELQKMLFGFKNKIIKETK